MDGCARFWAAWGWPLEGRMDRPMGRSMRGGLRLQNTPLGCICRLAGYGASRLLLSFFLSKRKEQSLSALRAAPMGQLRSETPLRRQKCSLRIRCFAPCGERPGRCPGPAALWKGRPQTLDPTRGCAGRRVLPGDMDSANDEPRTISRF